MATEPQDIPWGCQYLFLYSITLARSVYKFSETPITMVYSTQRYENKLKHFWVWTTRGAFQICPWHWRWDWAPFFVQYLISLSALTLDMYHVTPEAKIYEEIKSVINTLWKCFYFRSLTLKVECHIVRAQGSIWKLHRNIERETVWGLVTWKMYLKTFIVF